MSWSLRGVAEETREAVIEAARQSGLSVGEWLKSVLAEDDPTPAKLHADPSHTDPVESAVAQLRRRLSGIEGHSHPHAESGQNESNLLSAVIDDIARGLDTDEQARTKIEGLGRQAADPSAPDRATDPVDAAIHDLEQQIAGLNRQIAEPEPVREHAASLDEIRDSLTALLAQPRRQPSPSPDRATAVGAALTALEARVDEARRQIATPVRQMPTDDGLEDRLAEITNRLGPARAGQRPRVAPAPGNLASAIAEISERQRALDENPEALWAKREQEPLAATLTALRGDIATLTQRVTAIGRDEAMAHGSHADLAQRMDELVAARPRDRQLLDAIRNDLSAVRTALAESARRTGRNDGERARLDNLAGEIATLRGSVESAQTPSAIARLETRIAQLARALEAVMAARAKQPDAFALVHSNLDGIRRSIDALQPVKIEPGTDTALSNLDARLNQIAARVDQLLERAAPAEALDALKSEIVTLRAELAEQAQASSGQLNEQMRALSDRLDAGIRGNRDGQSLAGLEAQLAAMGERMGRLTPDLAMLERVAESLSALQAQLSGNRPKSVDAARAAAREAAREVSASRKIETKLIHSLRDDLDDLRRAAEIAERPEAAPEAANETLTQVVRRLSQLEREATDSAGASGSPPAIPRANRAAAAAWSAAYRGSSPGGEHPTAPQPSKTDIAALGELVASGGPAGQRSTDRRGDFIAAARRAAQAAEAVNRGEQAGPAKSTAFTRISEAIRSRKGSLLVAAAALALVLGAMQLTGRDAVGDGREQTLISPIEPEAADPSATSGDNGVTSPAQVTANARQPAMVAMAGAPDAALAFAEPISFANHFGGSVTPSAGSFTVGVTDAVGPIVPIDVATLLHDAASAPWPRASALASAAANGNAEAAFEIAARYAQAGSSDDIARAAAWYERAAVAGNAVAQYRVASLYERGQGVAQNMARAVDWYRRAAHQGNVEAMHNLAVLLSEGAAGPDGRDEALGWFHAAAEHGITDSQYNLGVIYGRGIGVDKNFAESYRWFAIAAAGGDGDAAGRRDQIGAKLPPEKVAAVLSAADQWRPEPILAAANTVEMTDGWDSPGDGIATAERQALVKTIQTLLAEHGYDPGPADGVEGPKTQQAIRAYQRNIGLSETGQIDGHLVTALADTRS